jgi:hypothetical protein
VGTQENISIEPGCYGGMDLKGTVTLKPGVYYVNGGSLDFGAQANVTGVGVTFILTGPSPATVATLDMNGGARIDLKAPEEGVYKGVLIYQDPAASTGAINKINGNSGSRLEGAFYFPKQKLEFSGNNGMVTDCLQLVAFRIGFTGNAKVNNTCPGSDDRTFTGTVVRLVE